MQYKSISPINYQSKGLSLTADRISMFNQEHEQKITMQIDDLEDDFHRPVTRKGESTIEVPSSMLTSCPRAARPRRRRSSQPRRRAHRAAVAERRRDTQYAPAFTFRA